MALPQDFKFPGVDAVQAEAERRAIAIFGKDWMAKCSQSTCSLTDDGAVFPCICRGKYALAFTADTLFSSLNKKLQDLPAGTPAWHEYYDDGALRSSMHYHEDIAQDPEDGSPADIEYYESGQVKATAHCRDGAYHDPSDGSPAVIDYYPDGAIEAIRHFRCGWTTDPDDGSPAVIGYHQDGTISLIGHYFDGKHDNPGDGTPATIHFNKQGEIIDAYDCDINTIPIEEARASIKAAQIRRVAAVLSNVDQAVIPAGMPTNLIHEQAAATFVEKDGR